MAYKLEESKAKGYGIVSQGSSTSAFLGTSQSFFLGGKQSTTIGTVNSFTAGATTSMTVGPSVNMSLAPNWDKGLGDKGKLQFANLTAKYDFSNNKNFAFHIAHEGSSTYATQAKFNCNALFQAVAGYQPLGEEIFQAYLSLITKMSIAVFIIEVALAVETLMEVLYIPEKPSELQMDLAKAIPATTNSLSSIAIAFMAIGVAMSRESVFKAAISPQSVITMDPARVFLGSAGNVFKQKEAVGLLLENGRATLGSRTTSPRSRFLQEPYKDKFTDFNDLPSSYLQVDTWQVQQRASKKIVVTAGIFPPDPSPDPVQIAITLQNTSAQAAYDAVINADLLFYDEHTTPFLAQKAKDDAYAAAQVQVDAAKAAAAAANGPYMVNPSVFLRAIEGPASMVQAETKIFNVKAPLITLQTNPLTSETCSVSLSPLSGISLQQSPLCTLDLNEVNEIVLRSGPTTSAEFTPTFVSINCLTNAIAMSSTGLNVDAPKITLTGALVQIGSGLKVLG